MARPSPGVERTIAILNFLAEHPGQAFTLTDFVKALKINQATCHAALNSLVEAGYLYRTSAKTYVLGPALFAVAKAAGDHVSPLQIAQPEMRQLADDYDVVCEALIWDGRYEAVVRARAEARPDFNTSRPLGTRMLLRPPFSAMYLAWSPEKVVDRWLENAEPPCTSEQRATMKRAMEFVRTHGYSFGVRNDTFTKPWDDPELLFSQHRTEFALMVKTELDRDRQYDGVFIASPVFEGENEIAFVLGMVGFKDGMKGSAVGEVGERLRMACKRISRFLQRIPSD